MAGISDVREVAIADLVIGEGQARVRGVEKEIDDLAESIRVHGLLEPIVICPAGSDSYEVLMGQRRLLAHKKLGRDRILAAVIDQPVDTTTAKVLSLTENLIRRDLDSKDVIDACTALFRKYGNARAVAEETGLPYSRVRQHVKYDRLVPTLRAEVDQGHARLDAALKAQDMTTRDGECNEKDALLLARALSRMTTSQQRQVMRERERHSDKPLKAVLAAVTEKEQPRQIVVTLKATEHQRIQSLARKRNLTQDEFARDLIRIGLEEFRRRMPTIDCA